MSINNINNTINVCLRISRQDFLLPSTSSSSSIIYFFTKELVRNTFYKNECSHVPYSIHGHSCVQNRKTRYLNGKTLAMKRKTDGLRWPPNYHWSTKKKKQMDISFFKTSLIFGINELIWWPDDITESMPVEKMSPCQKAYINFWAYSFQVPSIEALRLSSW